MLSQYPFDLGLVGVAPSFIYEYLDSIRLYKILNGELKIPWIVSFGIVMNDITYNDQF
jgi:hypothetical protein